MQDSALTEPTGVSDGYRLLAGASREYVVAIGRRGCRHMAALRALRAATGALAPSFGLILALLSALPLARADTLADCRALSEDDAEVQNCLDNFLDDLDDSMQLTTDQVLDELGEDARPGFARSQSAFTGYRRENCLWYVSFSEPRSLAEQLGKNCLINMSRERLAELRGLLVAGEQSRGRLQGYYAFGAELNTFIACGGGERYWVESDTGTAGELQQRYLDLATEQRQLLYAELQGTLTDEAQSYEGHRGAADITDIDTLRVPLESDCQVLVNTSVSTTMLANEENDAAGSAPAIPAAEAVGSRGDDTEPVQELRAYFGEWEAVCREQTQRFFCELSVALDKGTAQASPDDDAARLLINRSADERSTVVLRLAEVEIDSPARIRWQVDAGVLGDIALSVVRVDELATRQIVADPDYLSQTLFPALKAGQQLKIDVVDSVDDASGEIYTGTLMGLSRALGFADEFIGGSGL